MPEYNLSLRYQDSEGRQRNKRFLSQTLTDFAAALTAGAALVTDFEAICDAEVLYYSIAQEIVEADAGGATANVDEGITLTVLKADNKKATIKVPCPVPGLTDGQGNVDLTNALVTAYFENFTSAGDWTVSDGELATSMVKGVLDD